MELQEFRSRYSEAKRQCVEMTAPLILESLPAIHICFITLAREDRGADFTSDERLHEWYETFRKVGQTSGHEEDRMLNWLWRDDFAPFALRSIEISIYGTTAIHTTFEFLVTGAFSRTENVETPALKDHPLAPWAAKTPRIPAGWKSVAESGRFSINWHKKNATHAP